MNNVGDSFGWAFRDPAWPGKVLLQGLIVIIPVIGWIAMTGWLMLAFENARAGKNELPPAGFHLGRGIGIFLIFFIYGFVLNIPASVLYIAGSIAAGHSNSPANFGSPLIALALLWNFAASLFLRFLIPSLIVNTYHRGFAGGMDIQRVWRLATFNVSNSVIAGLIIFVASVIGGFGLVCCIGIIFTIPYENTINAGAAAWFEKMQTAPAAPGTPAA
jgi:uncharacterized protein DUF4013